MEWYIWLLLGILSGYAGGTITGVYVQGSLLKPLIGDQYEIYMILSLNSKPKGIL